MAAGAGSLVIYTLPASAYGYNLSNITVYSGWQDNGRDAQAYTVSFSTVDNPAVFTVLTSVNYNPSVPGSTPSANRVIIDDSEGGSIATNVAAVQFDFTTPGSENGYCGYGAITVGGTMATNLIVPPVAPTITGQPQSVIIYAGATANFTPTISGSPPLNYQWEFISNNVTNSLSGATNASLTINQVTAANAGSYQLFVTNSAGHANSSVATLTIITPAPGSYESAVLANGPLVYWSLDETNNPANGGAVAYDYVSGHNGVYQTGAQNGYDGIMGPQPPGFPGFPSDNPAMETFSNTANSYMTASVGSMVAGNLTYAMWINPTGPVESYAGLLMDRGAAGEGFGFGGTANAQRDV